jgi:hypothetical protein
MVSPDAKARLVAVQEKNRQALQRAYNLVPQIFRIMIVLGLASMLLGILGSAFNLSISKGVTVAIYLPLGLLIAAHLGVSGYIGIMTTPGAQKNAGAVLPCPICNQQINCAEPWICGHCRHVNNKPKPLADYLTFLIKQISVEINTPFSNCSSTACSKPMQTALQCPHCHHHIVIDKPHYQAESSHEFPFRRVARFEGDEHQPIIGTKYEPPPTPQTPPDYFDE